MSQSEPAKNSEEQELSEWEQDAMKRMESKFSLSPEEESPSGKKMESERDLYTW